MKQGAYREISIPSVALGILLGIIMTMAFVYTGLKLGFTIGGSSIAAILGFAVLRGIFRSGTILENNINQTVASGINIASAGIIFTLPSLFLMGVEFNIWAMGAAAVAGSILGVVIIIPLRRQMIEIERLRFPSGMAVAAILKSPGAGRAKAILLAAGCLAGGMSAYAVKTGLVQGVIPVGDWLGLPAYANTAVALSLMNFGTGMLAGRGGLPFPLGGAVSWWLLAPLAVHFRLLPPMGPGDVPAFIQGDVLRPVGIGLLIGGALLGVVLAYPSVRNAFRCLSGMPRARGSGTGERGEMGGPSLAAWFLLSSAMMFLCTHLSWNEGILLSLLVSLAGVLWMIIAGIVVAQCTGATDISPLSGLSLIAISVIMAMTGNNLVIAVMTGVAVCVATGQCADMMQDLKTGHLVGAHPGRQQAAQLAVAWMGPLAAIGTLLILWKGGGGPPGFGPESPACAAGSPECLSAPQADALRGMIQGIMSGNAPVEKYAAGAIIGAVLTLLPVGGIGVLVGLGMYLPFSVTLGFGAGCLASMALEKFRSPLIVEERIFPLASGFIIGEAVSELVYSIAKIL